MGSEMCIRDRCIEGTEMAGDKGICAISVVPDGRGGEGPGISNRVGVGEKIRVNEPQFPLLKD